MRTRWWRRIALVAALAASPAAARPVSAQGFRITGTSVADWVSLRPLQPDSIVASAAGDTVAGSTGDLRHGPNGQIVRCLAGEAYCYFRRPVAPIAGLPLTQDIEGTAWGLARGLRGYVHLRGRTSVGNAGDFWPQANDPVDVLAAYLELDRGRWRARAGRQWHASGLGYYDFDGAALLWRARTALALEGYAGWSLERGLNEPATSSEIAALEPFAPDERAYLFGAEAHWRPNGRFATSAVYQRELRTDRAGLYSERAAGDARARWLGATLDGRLVYDVAELQTNEARLRLQLPTWHRANLALQARHHRPFFELWTIWGAFSPVGFDEGLATVDWRPRGSNFSYAIHGGYRTYAQTDAAIGLRTNGWRAGADVSWHNLGHVSASGSYDVDIGSGASSTDARASLRWLQSERMSVGVTASITQSIYEFRIGTGRMYGLAIDGSTPLTDEVRLVGDIGLYQHALTNGAPGPDWTQRRASIQLEWMLGRDPGMAGAAP